MKGRKSAGSTSGPGADRVVAGDGVGEGLPHREDDVALPPEQVAPRHADDDADEREVEEEVARLLEVALLRRHGGRVVRVRPEAGRPQRRPDLGQDLVGGAVERSPSRGRTAAPAASAPAAAASASPSSGSSTGAGRSRRARRRAAGRSRRTTARRRPRRTRACRGSGRPSRGGRSSRPCARRRWSAAGRSSPGRAATATSSSRNSAVRIEVSWRHANRSRPTGPSWGWVTSSRSVRGSVGWVDRLIRSAPRSRRPARPGASG